MVQKFAPLVKRQIEYWLQQIEFYPPTHLRYRPQKVARYRELVRDFDELLDHLNVEEGTDLKPEPPRPPSRNATRDTHNFQPKPNLRTERPITPQVSKDDLSDLPPELLAELSGGAKAESDPLIQIINSRGGTATLDEILIDLYRNYKEVGKRTLVGNKLYRLGKRDLVWSVPGRKGIYTTIKPAGATSEIDHDDSSEDDEGPGAATSGPSTDMGAAGSPVGPSKSAPKGPIPFASTPIRRRLMSEASTLTSGLPFEQKGVR